MSLGDKVKELLKDFEGATSSDIMDTLQDILPHLKNPTVSEYLEGKIQKIHDVTDEQEKKSQCKALIPYLDWYLQGLQS